MTAYEIIAKKRDKNVLTADEIRFFVNEFLNGKIEDYQMTAFLMAVYFQGMDEEEVFALTETFIKSGKKIDLSTIPGIKVDKHSTGGVGDKVSIVLAPLVASLGVPVPMISGRGLGHTGGTLDKLESIPGFHVFGSHEKFKKQLADIGVAMFGQTEDIVPADRRIYALRDVTATIESIPLIAASIMSKKIAEGIDALVLDVKFGNGAFMQDPVNAEQLARFLIKVGEKFGKKVVAYLTSMDQPLGYKIGNWLEIQECIDCFHGNGPSDLMEVILTLASEMVVLGEKGTDLNQARQLCQTAIEDGSAFQKFLTMVEYQGGDTNVIESFSGYETAAYRKELRSTKSGYVTALNTQELGFANVQLGAGRARIKDPVDPQAGMVVFKKLGDYVAEGESLLEVRTNKKDVLDTVSNKLITAISVDDREPEQLILIDKRITSNKL